MKKIQTLLVLAGVAIVLIINSCGSDGGDIIIQTSETPEPRPDYVHDVQPIMERYCTNCHANKKGAAKLSLANYVSVVKEARRGDLFLRIHSDTMPMPPKKLMSDSLLGVIGQWAEVGYPMGVPDTTR